jgi:hypothetical protein
LALTAADPGRTRRRRLSIVIGLAAFLVWQAWLWRTFGEPGIGSGGAMSTGFELIR